MVVVVLLGIIVSAGVVQAKAGDKAITVDLRGLSMGIISCDYEWKVSQGMSGSIQGFYANMKKKENGEDIQLGTLAVAIGARKYLNGQALDGIYLGLYGTAASITVTSPQEANATSIGVSGVVGLKWVSNNNIAIDIGVGMGIPLLTRISASEIDLNERVVLGSRGIGITLGIGYSW